jgi:hypothetical protein
MRLREGLDAAAAAALEADPQARLDALERGELAGLDGETRARLRGADVAALERQAAEGVEAARKDLNAQAILIARQEPEAFLRQVEAGTYASLPPETLARHVNGARGRLESAAEGDAAAEVTLAISGNPAIALLKLENGEWGDRLTRKQIADAIVRARNAVEQRDAALAREAEAAERELQREIGDFLTQTRDLAQSSPEANVVLPDPSRLLDPDVRGHPDYARTMAAIELRADHAGWATKTPDELATILREERARPVTEAYQAKRVEAVRARLEEVSDGWSTRPLEFAAELGLEVPELDVEGGLRDPQALAGQLRDRARLSAELQARGYVRRPALLTAEEKAALEDAAAGDAPPEQRLRLAQALAAAGVPAVAVGGDRLFAYAQGSLASQMPAATVQRIFRGAAVIAEGNVVMPPLAERLGSTHDQVADFFDTLPDGDALQADVIAAADAIYASRHRNTAEAIDSGAYRQALHEAMGGTGPYDDTRRATGGLAKLRGVTVSLPAGVSLDEAEDAMDALERQAMVIDARGGFRGERTLPDDLAAAVSIDGRLPRVAGQPLTRRSLANAVPMPVAGSDRYVLVLRQNAGVFEVAGEDGRPWVFSLRALIRETSR